MIEEMLAKQQKIAAKKSLYFSIALLVEWSMRHIQVIARAVDELGRRQAENETWQDNVDPQTLGKVAISEQLSALRNVYCISMGLKNYKEAFGEYPEFTRFLFKTGSEKEIDDFITLYQKMVTQAKTLMDKGGVEMSFPAGENLNSLMFNLGGEYQKACERVKLKGEA